MKFNEKEIVLKSNGKSQFEGRLNYKKLNSSSYYQSVFKERWFKLIDNCLFYFRISDSGVVTEKEPVGLLVLENASIQLEHGYETPFAFSVSFIDEPEKKHMFSGMTELGVTQWVQKLRCASYEYLRSQLHVLQSKIYLVTGMDPLLMVPRNEGSKKWAPGEPLPIELNHHDKKNSSQHASVVRSKSSASVFHKGSVNEKEKYVVVETRGSGGLERSRTTAHVFSKRHNPFNTSEFYDNAPHSSVHHLRPAPSPPTRKRTSPKNVLHNDSQSNSSLDNNVLNNHPDILPLPPRPPSRRNSPRRTVASNESVESSQRSKNFESTTDDLIQF